MLDLVVWAAASAYQKWKSGRSVAKEGSEEDLRLLKDMVEALKSDNDLIAGILEVQKKKHESLEKRVMVAYLIIVILAGLITWLLFSALIWPVS